MLAEKEGIHKIDKELKDATTAIAVFRDQVKTLVAEKETAMVTTTRAQAALETATEEVKLLKGGCKHPENGRRGSFDSDEGSKREF